MLHCQKTIKQLPKDHNQTAVYNIFLLLLSALLPNVECDIQLLNIEFQLCYTQCIDCLDELHNALCV